MISLAKREVVQQVTGGIVITLVGQEVPHSVRFFTGFAIPNSYWLFVAGLTITILAGVIFGTYPAAPAAHLDPAEALKDE
jgi:putative ABC transport system permease protein